MSFNPPDAHFDVVQIDIVGPLPPSQGYQQLLTCIDRFTHWPEAFPPTDITAESVARAFVLGWIARFGVPSTVITDRGRQFESNLWSQLSQLFGIHRQRTTAYHLNCCKWHGRMLSRVTEVFSEVSLKSLPID